MSSKSTSSMIWDVGALLMLLPVVFFHKPVSRDVLENGCSKTVKCVYSRFATPRGRFPSQTQRYTGLFIFGQATVEISSIGVVGDQITGLKRKSPEEMTQAKRYHSQPIHLSK